MKNERKNVRVVTALILAVTILGVIAASLAPTVAASKSVMSHTFSQWTASQTQLMRNKQPDYHHHHGCGWNCSPPGGGWGGCGWNCNNGCGWNCSPPNVGGCWNCSPPYYPTGQTIQVVGTLTYDNNGCALLYTQPQEYVLLNMPTYYSPGYYAATGAYYGAYQYPNPNGASICQTYGLPVIVSPYLTPQ